MSLKNDVEVVCFLTRAIRIFSKVVDADALFERDFMEKIFLFFKF